MRIFLRAQSLFFILVILAEYVHGYEYIYPVAQQNVAGESLVYLLYQKEPLNISLWEWNSSTKRAKKILPSLYCPAGFRLLPDGSGFSFIDNDRLRIKLFSKRSAHSCEFNEPLHHLGIVTWSENGFGYFSARLHGRYTIFQINSRGDYARFIGSDQYDCLYPQCVGATIFYLQRSTAEHALSYTIKAAPFKNCIESDKRTQSLDEALADLIHNDGISSHATMIDTSMTETVIAFGSCPVMHLTMISDTLGWVIEQPKRLAHDASFIMFACHIMYKIDDIWQSHHLFDFSIPTNYVLGNSNERLYESLLPLLPRYCNGAFYFVDSCQAGALTLYRYDPVRTHRVQLTPHGQFFSPLNLGTHIICGGDISQMEWDENGGEIQVDLPIVAS